MDDANVSGVKSANAVSMEDKSSEQTKAEAQGRRDLLKALVLCLLAVILVRSFLFEPFKIPSGSMIPTLRIGDHIFVSKFNYGLFIPFTKFEFLAWGSPKRGEVIVFLSPRDESLHYIKRVVGIPGDKIEFKGKDLYVNGEKVYKELVIDPAQTEKILGGAEVGGDIYKETLGNEHYVRYSHGKMTDFARQNQVETIPENMFFVIGDNRDESYDSRSWGYVPRHNIKGKAQIVWLSLEKTGGWNTFGKVRWSRSGTLIR